MEHTGFPSEETLAAFIDGRLDAETRRRVVEHLAECPECYETFLGVGELARDHAANPPLTEARSPSMRRGWYVAALSTAAAVSIVFFGPDFYRRVTLGRDASRASLIAAANRLSYRSIQSRLSSSFIYKEPERITRGDAQDKSTDPDIFKLRGAANDAEERAVKNPSVENLLTHGEAALLNGDLKKSQKALEEALQKSTGLKDIPAALRACRDVYLLHALAALYTERADFHQADALLALEAADSAWKLAETPVTAWNRALALEGLHSQEAEAAWLQYLRLDRSSAWTDEALRNLKRHRAMSSHSWAEEKEALDKAALNGDREAVSHLVSRFCQETRVHAEDEVLQSWAQDVRSGKPSEDSLRLLRVLGDALGQINGEMLVRDLVDRITESDRRTQSAIADSVMAYTDARRLHSAQNASRAVTALAEAGQSFRRERFPLWFRADVLRATSLYYAGRPDEALVLLESVEDKLGSGGLSDRYPAVHAQMFWTRGLINGSQGRFIEALRDYQSSSARFERLHETENTAFLLTLIAQAHDFMGQTSKEWNDYLRVAEIIEQNPAMRRAPLMLGHIARVALAHDYVAASRAFHEATSKYDPTLDPSFHVDALLALARSAADAGQQANAHSALEQAVDSARSIADEKVRRRIENDIEAVAADAGMAVGETSEARLTEAIADAERDRDQTRKARYYFLRAKYRSSQGRGAAIDDFAAAVATLQGQGTAIRGVGDVRDWRRKTRTSFDQAIGFAMRSGRPTLGLAWAERARVQTRGPARSPMDESAVAGARAALQPGDAVLEYWSTDTELYVWSISSASVESSVVPVGRAALRELSSRIIALLADGRDDDARRALGEANERLLTPLGGAIARANRLLIVVDESIATIPYAALFDHSTSKYAVERFQVVLVPSLDAAAAFSTRRSDAGQFETALVVADPAFDSDLLPSLKRLPQASSDIDVVRRHFRATEVLGDEKATSALVAASMARVKVIHFAGHSISDSEQPSLSALVLAPDHSEHDAGLLYARHIEELDLRGVDLVVLASCASASGEAGSDGFAAISRAFTGAGVRNVVGTLWDIRDGSSADMMSAFYDSLAVTNDVAAALHEAQLLQIHKTGRLSWAAFEMLTGA